MTQFKKGQSGNPNGRPKSDTASLKPLLAKHGKNVLQKVIDTALEGDLTACKLVLDRLYPAIKSQQPSINIKSNIDSSLTEQGQEIIAEVFNGNVSPDIATNLMAILNNQAKLVELEIMTEKIESIHSMLKGITNAKAIS